MSYDIKIYHYGEVVMEYKNLDKGTAKSVYCVYFRNEDIYTELIKDGIPLKTAQSIKEFGLTPDEISRYDMQFISLGKDKSWEHEKY